MRDDPAAIGGKREPAMPVVSGHDAEIVRTRMQYVAHAGEIAWIERQRGHAVRPARVERHDRFRAREHDLRVAILRAQFREQRRQQQRIAEQQMMCDQNPLRMQRLAAQRLRKEPRQRVCKNSDTSS